MERNKSNFVLLASAGVLLVLFLLVVGAFYLLSSTNNSNKCVAVIELSSPIELSGQQSTLFSSGSPGSEEIADTISSLNKRSDIGAVLLVVNSPGGSVVATREIYTAYKELNKPKVAYFREVAASGAYYISTASDYIISDPDAITGSIGVIATFTQLSGLFDKLGLGVETIKSAEHKDIGSAYRNMTPSEKKILQSMIDEVYSEFRSVVLENRKGKLDLSKFDEITDGRILSGRQALKVGLVDEVGSKKDAILKASNLAGNNITLVSDVKICNIPTISKSAGVFDVKSLSNLFNVQKSSVGLEYR